MTRRARGDRAPSDVGPDRVVASGRGEGWSVIGRAAVRFLGAGAAGLALWHRLGAGHVYGRGVASVVAGVLATRGWATHVGVAPAGAPPGLHVVLWRTAAGGAEITRGIVPLTWHHLDTVTSGTVVLAALFAAAGPWRRRAGTRTPDLLFPAIRALAAFVLLFLAQSLAIFGVIAGSLPGGAAVSEQAGGLLETGATLVLPPLVWAWATFGRRPAAH